MPDGVIPAAQIPLDLSLRPDYGRARFVNAQSNHEARAALAEGVDWANNALALIGPAGVGKTHLGHLWAAANDALVLCGDDDLSGLGAWRGRHIWLDDAGAASEALLFALINMGMRGEIKALLLCARDAPSTWAVDIPDLRSRLGAMQVARIDPPEDELLEAIYRKLFMDRGLKVADNLISYLLLRQGRSVDAAYAVVDRLDKLSAAQKANVTRSFAAKFLDEQGELF